MHRLKKHAHALRALHDSKPAARKVLLKTANKELIDCICLCVKNVLKGNVRIPKETYRKLKRHQKVLNEVRKNSVGVSKKKQLLIQQGGFLPALLAPILGIAGSLISGLIK